jgi:hypothetical protein
MRGRDVMRGAVALASWWLVQVPVPDLKTGEPGSTLPPIHTFKKVKQFDSAGACEAYRDVALQDGAMMGSQAMLDQASSLRCASDAELQPPASPAPTP